MYETITLNDGTEIRGHCRNTGVGLYVYAFGLTLDDVYQMMADDGKSQIIRSTENGETKTFAGYTHLKAISEEMNGAMICATMIKESR